MFNLRAFLQVLATVIKIFNVTFAFRMYINSLNQNVSHKTVFFYILCIQTRVKRTNK